MHVSHDYTTLDVPGATGGTRAYGIDDGNIVGSYYDGSGKVGIPYNIIIDAKTRKVLVKKVGLSQVESTIAKYLN